MLSSFSRAVLLGLFFVSTVAAQTARFDMNESPRKSEFVPAMSTSVDTTISLDLATEALLSTDPAASSSALPLPTIQVIPEPPTFVLAIAALLAVAALRRRRVSLA